MEDILKKRKKIEAIKNLRDVSGDIPDPIPGVPDHTKKLIGLAHAKWAVENWDKWIGFVETHGRIPKNDVWFFGTEMVLT